MSQDSVDSEELQAVVDKGKKVHAHRTAGADPDQMAAAPHPPKTLAAQALPTIETPASGRLLSQVRSPEAKPLPRDRPEHSAESPSHRLRSKPRKLFSVASGASQLSSRWPRWVYRTIAVDRRLVSTLVAASAVYGIGHSVVAWVVGFLAGGLARLGTPQDTGVVPLVTLCVIGCVALCAKALGAIGLARAEALVAGHVGVSLRRSVASALLRAGSHCTAPDTLARLSVGIRDVETDCSILEDR